MKTNLAKNTIMLSFCTILNKGLLFIMVPLFSRWLTAAEYGDYDVYATYITLLIPLITLSCSDAIFRLTVDKKNVDSKKYYITNGLSIVLINLCISIILIFVIGKLIKWDVTVPFIVLLVGETFDNYLQGYLRAIKKLNIYAITKSVSVIATAIMVTLFVRFIGLGLNGIIYGYALGFLISSLFSIFITKWWKFIDRSLIEFKGVKELISYSYALIPNSISWWFINVSDRTIIKIFLGSVANGIYGITSKIPNLCSSVFNMFSISWQETATELVDSKERNTYFENVYNSTIRTLITICIGIVSCNFFFFNILFDHKYFEGYMYTSILVSAIIFSCISQFFGGIQISLKNPKANGVSTMIGAIANLIIHLAVIKVIGLYAAAISTLLSNVIVTIIRYMQLKKDIKLKINKTNYIYIIIYLYISIMSFYINNNVLNILDLLLATCVFIIANIDFIKKILLKLKIIKNVRKEADYE